MKESEAFANALLDQKLITDTHKHLENHLVHFRDDRISSPLSANGLVIKEKDGSNSHIIRLGTRESIEIALRFIVADLIERGR